MRYHFIGDKGISMRGLKKYLSGLGYEVSGSDLRADGHHASNITAGIDVVVRSSAVSPGSPGWVEVEEAKKLGIKVIKRSELLSEITQSKKLIAISGMHGKTTVTAMIGLTLIEAGLDPTVLVGEEVQEFNDVLRVGHSEYFVAEVCEYDRSFLDIFPNILILTNIEEEHLDTYPGGLPEIKSAFLEYVSHVPADGVIIACADDENVVEVLKKANPKAEIIYYGFKSENYYHLDFPLSLPGRHNQQNALAVIALADCLQIDQEITRRVLGKFKGAHRRFEIKGSFNGADIIDDYGHHPSEIRATIEALNERYPDKKLNVVFWPHQYKRVKPLLKEFGRAFGLADQVIIKPIFFVPGRDEELDVTSFDLANEVNGDKKIARVIENDEEIIQYLKNTLNKDSVLLTIGIPPVYKIADALVSE